MEVKTARNASSLLNIRPAKKQVCRFWLQGRCNRNPCRFMHTELPPLPHPRRSMTWKNPNSHPVSKKGHVDPLEKALTDSRKRSVTEQVSKKGHVDPLEKALTDSRKSNLTEQVSKKGHVDPLEKALADSRKRSLTEQVSKNKKLDHVDQSTLEKSSQPLQCKLCPRRQVQVSTMLAKLEGHTEAVTGISLPSGSNKLYSVGKDRTVRVWDCSSGQCAGSAVTDSEFGCLVSEGPWLFVGLQNVVKAWNIENNIGFSLNAPCGLVCSVVVEDDTLIAGMEDGTILVWKQHPDTKIPEPAAMVREHNGSICSLVIGTDRLFSGSKDCTIKVFLLVLL
ncbi:hypothetical protein ACS0TY_024062 [Phlomoides rotata]